MIGNGAYKDNPLRNPTNDADDVSKVLKDAGFEVTVVKDADQTTFEKAVKDFSSRLSGADTGLFYYAGHGVQIEGVNYLIPVSPRLDNVADVKLRAMAVDSVVARMEQSGIKTALVFLDSCRDNPFPGASRSTNRGLAVVPTPKTRNSLIAYATAPGEVAADGTGRNGVFSAAFIAQVAIPGQELSELMRKVSADVAAATGGKQNPRVDFGMQEPFWFISPDEMAFRAEAALKANQEEIARLEKELAERQARINATRDAQAKQALEVEQQRQAALAAAKKLETEGLAREAERQRKLAEEANRAAAERAALAAEQAKQQAVLASIASSRRAELEKLARDAESDNPDVLIETIERLDRVLADVAKEYASTWKSIEAKLREGYTPRFVALSAAKPELWETDAEFSARIKKERTSLEREMEQAVASRKAELEAEQVKQTAAMRKQYEDALALLARKTWVLQRQSVGLQIGEFDRNERTWPFTVSSFDPTIPMEPRTFVVNLASAPDVRKAIVDLDTAVKAGALAGRIEWALRRNRDKGWYELVIRRVSVENLTTSATVAAWQGEVTTAYFTPGKRQSPSLARATLRLTSPDAGGRLYRDGVDMGPLPISLSLPAGPYGLEIRWSDRTTSISGALEIGANVSRSVVKPLPLMLPVAGGSFEMGSNNEENDERPVHRVTVSSFFMSATEVTQAQYKEVMGINPSNFTGGSDVPMRPVENVSWYDAVLFCNKLSQKEGYEPAYYSDADYKKVYTGGDAVYWKRSANGYRLPTEAEWEYAARGGALSRGYPYAGSAAVDEVAWYSSNSRSTRPVGTKKPNKLGLYDMSGNVWEWCWDWYGGYGAGSVTNPAGPSSGTSRVLQGGGWGYDASGTRVADRSNSSPSISYYNSGFRLVRPQSE